jgi:hypothetical protein
MFLYRPTRSVTGRRFSRLGRNYIITLSLVLMGYALAGRGFAYLGVAPIYVGEMTLAFGLFALLGSGQTWRMLRLTYFMPLILFMCWGAARTLPFLQIYGVDAVRDAVVWGYGLFAIATAGVLVSVPERLALLVKYFQRYAVIFLFLLPFLWMGSKGFGGSWPINPLTGWPIIEVKGGDACVQLAGIFAFLVTLGGSVNPWIGPLMIPLDIALNLEGRAGMLTFMVGACFAVVLKPLNVRTWRILGVIGGAIFLLWATGLEIKNVGGGREISFDYLVQTVQSVVSEKHADPMLEGSKEWRLHWWHDILNYTIHGKYFWTGKGFGINLANDDNYQVAYGGLLRSPHNGHLTILARSGVPGIVLWGITQLTFAGLMLRELFRARRRSDYRWAGLFMVLLTYWAALLTNASFDVFIEGPMGGIWLWSIYGIGIASSLIFRRYPQVLYLPPNAVDV